MPNETRIWSTLTRPQVILVVMWFIGFALCVCTALFYWADIPSTREPFLRQAFDSFAPGLGVMFAALFTKSRASRGATASPSHTKVFQITVADYSALAFASLYILGFVVGIIGFLRQEMTLDTVVGLFAAVRQYTNWLVLPVLAYYFGSHRTAQPPSGPPRARRTQNSPK